MRADLGQAILFDRITRAWQALGGRGLSSVDTATAAEIFRVEGALPTQWLPASPRNPSPPQPALTTPHPTKLWEYAMFANSSPRPQPERATTPPNPTR